MPGDTASQKILARASGRARVEVGEIVWAKVDAHLMHDNQGPFRMGRDFAELGLPIWDKERFMLTADHHNPPTQDSQANVLNVTRAWAAEQALPHFYDAEGICHILMAEKGFVRPGALVTGTDSHTTNTGALGALGVAIGPTESIGVLAKGEIWLRVPETIRVHFGGRLPKGVYGKDMALRALRDLKVDGAEYKVLQFEGEALMALPVEDRMTLSNMAAEFSAKSAIMDVDEWTRDYLREAGAEEGWEAVHSDSDATYAASYEYDVSDLSPQVACPHRMDNVRSVEEVDSPPLHRAHIGSCTGAKLVDLQAAAAILKGRRVAAGLQLLIAPASKAIMGKSMADGTLGALIDAGGVLLPTTCGICAGRGAGQLGDGEVCVSSANRNYRGRMGSLGASIYLASAATVAASAIRGRVADPREFIA